MNKPHSQADQNGTSRRPQSTTSGAGVTAVLNSMIRATDEEERSDERALTERPRRARTVDVRDASIAAPPASPGDRSPAGERPSSMPMPPNRLRFSEFADLGHPRWSVAAATALGLPARYLEAFEGLEEHDDAAWINTLVKATRRMCKGVEDRPTLLVSSGGTELAEALGLEVHRPGSLPPYGGSIFCTIEPSAEHTDWLHRIRGDRALHLVLDGSDSDWLTYDEPDAVSYTTHRGALEAIKLADYASAKIAFGINSSGRPIRVTPLELALSIRTLFRTR